MGLVEYLHFGRISPSRLNRCSGSRRLKARSLRTLEHRLCPRYVHVGVEDAPGTVELNAHIPTSRAAAVVDRGAEILGIAGA